MRSEEQDHGDKHEPVELEAGDVDDQCFFRLHVLDRGGDVVGILRDVDGLNDDRCKSSGKHVHGSADQCLVCAEINARDAQKGRVNEAHEHGGQDYQQDDHESGSACREIFHDQGAAQSSHDHDAFQAQVDDARVFGEAAAERDQHQNGCKQQCVLNEQDHFSSPPFLLPSAEAGVSVLPAAGVSIGTSLLLAVFLLRFAICVLMKYRKNATKPQR